VLGWRADSAAKPTAEWLSAAVRGRENP